MTSEIGYQIRFQPKEASTKILDAIRKAGGHKGRAAEILGCRHGTLIEWIKALDLRESVDSLIEKGKKEGWYDVSSGGRPPSKKPATAKTGAKKRAARKPAKKARARARRATS